MRTCIDESLYRLKYAPKFRSIQVWHSFRSVYLHQPWYWTQPHIYCQFSCTHNNFTALVSDFKRHPLFIHCTSQSMIQYCNIATILQCLNIDTTQLHRLQALYGLSFSHAVTTFKKLYPLISWDRTQSFITRIQHTPVNCLCKPVIWLLVCAFICPLMNLPVYYALHW